MAKIVHLTTVHPPFDTRIFLKQAKTLLLAGHDISLIAQHDKNEVVAGVKIIALPKPGNRFVRITCLTWHAFYLAFRQRADIYHFHDPELLLIGVLLKGITKAVVIYDAHEDFPAQILTKHWIPSFLRKPIAYVSNLTEKLMAIALDSVVVATERIADNFRSINPVVIHNYPDLISFTSLQAADAENKEKTLIYIGGISKIRGAIEMVRALEHMHTNRDSCLYMIGPFWEDALEEELRLLPGYKRVQYLGQLPWVSAWQQAQSALVGLVLFHPIPNYLDSMPTKLFEYMATGLPVIASNFPHWKEILEDNHCGLVVDPLNPKEIARAIEYLLDHPEEASRMGENGRQAVKDKYNWEEEGKKLLDLYERLLTERKSYRRGAHKRQRERTRG